MNFFIFDRTIGWKLNKFYLFGLISRCLAKDRIKQLRELTVFFHLIHVLLYVTIVYRFRLLLTDIFIFIIRILKSVRFILMNFFDC